MKLASVFFGLFCAIGSSYAQGPYAPNAETPGTAAIHFSSEQFVSWASEIQVIRGYKDLANKSLGYVNFGTAMNAVGYSDRSAVSLGDSGVAYVYFDGWVVDEPGADFAVFENSFNHDFLELGFVEVSKDGKNYTRFPAQSETSTGSQISSFDLLDATNIHNLAGKYKVGYGTPFDLSDVGLDSVRSIRVIDVVGSINPTIASKDASGRLINDPYPTDFQNNGFYTGGFDLESVGLINYDGEIFVGEAEIAEQKTEIKLYPNPMISDLTVDVVEASEIRIYDLKGKVCYSEFLKIGRNDLQMIRVPKGIYSVTVINSKEHFVSKLVVQ